LYSWFNSCQFKEAARVPNLIRLGFLVRMGSMERGNYAIQLKSDSRTSALDDSRA